MRARHFAHGVPAQRVAGVHADADNIAGLDCFRHNRFQRLINQDGFTRLARSGRGEHKKPARRDDRGAE